MKKRHLAILFSVMTGHLAYYWNGTNCHLARHGNALNPTYINSGGTHRCSQLLAIYVNRAFFMFPVAFSSGVVKFENERISVVDHCVHFLITMHALFIDELTQVN